MLVLLCSRQTVVVCISSCQTAPFVVRLCSNQTTIKILQTDIVPMEFRVHFFPRIGAFSRRTKMHLNGMLLIGTEFFKL